MGNEHSQMNGLELEEKAIEITDYWTLYSALLNTSSGETRLSIFKGEPVVQGQLWANKTPLEKAAKNLMLYRHPCILKYFSSWNKGSNYYLAVENVKPLGLSLNQQSSIQICLGLKNIIRALVFLHEQAYSYHNNVCISSIYVSENGQWKLGGLEFLTRISDITQEFLVKSKPYRSTKSIDPEEVKNKAKGSDQYALAILVSQLLKNMKNADLDGITEFKEYCSSQLKHSNPDMRPNLSALLLHPFFNHDFILIHSFLTDLAIKSTGEKSDFFRKLHSRLKSLNENDTAAHLGELLVSRMVLLDVTAQNFLLPHLFNPKTNENPDGLFSEPIFQKCIAPKLLKVFRVRDLQIRMILLQHFASYSHLFNKTDLSEHILPELLVGIKDNDDELVATTLHSLADLVPLLGSATVVGGKRGKLFSDGRPKDMSLHKLRNIPMGKSKIPSELDLTQNKTLENREVLQSKSPYAIAERLSPDGGEDINTSISQKNDNEEWSDWDSDSNHVNDVPILPMGSTLDKLIIDRKEIKYNANNNNYNDITNLDIKVQKTKTVEQTNNEFDFFHDMEPVIQASNIFVVDEIEENPSGSKKFEMFAAGDGVDGWDNGLNDWSD